MNNKTNTIKKIMSYKVQNRLTETQEIIKTYCKTLERAEELKKALEDYTKNNINKTFFDKYFLIKGEYRDFHAFNISEKQYKFSGSHNFEIYLEGHIKIEIDNRERVHILEKTNETIELVKTWLLNAQKREMDILNMDEEAIHAELLAIYEKHGKPDAFRLVLESFCV